MGGCGSQSQVSCLRRQPLCSFETLGLQVRLADQGTPGICLSPPPQTHTMSRLFTWVLGLNSSLQAYMASTLPAPGHIFE